MQPKRTLTLFDAVCIVVGSIIGAGIFQTAPDIARFSGSFGMLMVLWLAGGALTIVGALCFAELTTRFKETIGGDYGYLKSAFGRNLAFLFAWTTFWIIRPGNLGAMAITFAEYLDQVLGNLDENMAGTRKLTFAIAAVAGLSLINLIGLKQGRITQNLMTVTKVGGILAIVAIAFCFGNSNVSDPIAESPPMGTGNWLLAIVLIMFSFGGWNDMSFVANEVKHPDRNLFRTLVVSAILVTAIYLILNVAFVFVLGFAGTCESQTVATDVIRTALGEESTFGKQSARMIACLICISCLGAMNGIVITSPRIYYAAGRDYKQLKWIGSWDELRNQPWIATMLQALVTILLFVLCFQYENPFRVILVVSAPFFWAFLGMTGLALIVLRRKVRVQDSENSYRVPFYPFSPLLLAISCFAMMWSAVDYAVSQKYWGAGLAICGIMIAGIILSLIIRSDNSTVKIDAD